MYEIFYILLQIIWLMDILNFPLHIIAFSKTKEESKLIQSYIDNASVKYLVEVV